MNFLSKATTASILRSELSCIYLYETRREAALYADRVAPIGLPYRDRPLDVLHAVLRQDTSLSRRVNGASSTQNTKNKLVIILTIYFIIDGNKNRGICAVPRYRLGSAGQGKAFNADDG